MSAPPEGLSDALADRYSIDREIGHGATATVYLARDRKHDRPVAIKVLSPDVALTVRTERFLREIQIAARLQHPHILPLHDSGEAGGFLYYVMPYVAGETLRDRLARDGPLPIPEALRITQEVASALGYAHGQGVVHRDIKPANILLSAGHAVVADFGIARAIIAGEAGEMTATGVSLGTPAYMSPEQVSGEPLDGRSDIYSLGCVLYEMLAGKPPFTGPSTQAVLAQHLVDPVPPLRRTRPEVPAGIEAVVEKAMAKHAAERFAASGELTQALTGEIRVHGARARRQRGVLVTSALALGVVAIAVTQRARLPRLAFGAAAPSLDSLRYLVLPFERDSGLAPALKEDQLFQDAIGQWSGVTLADPFRVKEALGSRPAAALSTQAAHDVAVGVGAGRYVRGSLTRLGDSIRVHADLYDATSEGSPVRAATAKVGLGLRRADSTVAALAERLLFGDSSVVTRFESRVVTRSFPARRAFVRGLAAVGDWNLAGADSAFVAAATADPGFAQADLWVAQVRFWNDTVPATWRSNAERAAAGRERLSERDQALADALLSYGQEDIGQACQVWANLTRREYRDFGAWYSLATCLRSDAAVLRDAKSPSGWRFRSSYYRATKAYQRAFELLPAIHKALGAGAYASVRRLLWTSGSATRRGRAPPPDTTSFDADPAWQGDTLAFVPYPRYSTEPRAIRETTSLATQRERELFHDIATVWATEFPQSADATEALAISLELLGRPSALDTLRRARDRATDRRQAFRLAGNEVLMRIKFSAPLDAAGLTAAKSLADSLLSAYSPDSTPEPLLLASLAALTGRANRASVLARRPAAIDWLQAPEPLAQTAAGLLAFAATGGPVDSLRELEDRLASALDGRIIAAQRQEVRMEWLGRPARLAFPVYAFRSLPSLTGQGDYLLDGDAAVLRGDTDSVRRLFSGLRRERRSVMPSDLTFDSVYPEAWLLAAVGDDRAAAAWLDPTLASLPTSAPQVLMDPANAGALVRAMALRAELAGRLGDARVASQWGKAVGVLWSSADEFLQPSVRRMQELAR